MAKMRRVFIRRGRTGRVVLSEGTYLEPDEDLNRAMSMEWFKEEAKEYVKSLYRNGGK
ncbi:MAG: hypothetical protein LIP06_12810 [Tannerellaceae bacterium]|nr:hypothetical protein [Tannerellaceae bacterium]